jgi:hypothetical protein
MDIILSPQLNKLSTRHFPCAVEPAACMMTAVTLCRQARYEGIVELSPMHTGLILFLVDPLHG